MTIDGRGVPADDYFDVVNPATGEVFERAPKCSPAQLDDAMDAAARAFPAWSANEELRVAALRNQSLDPDMVDERARVLLNFARKDDIIIFTPTR